MLNLLDFPIHQTVFFITLLLAILSAVFLLHPKVPLKYIKFHIGILAFPPIIAFIGLFTNDERVILGPWRFDGLSWLIVSFVLMIGLIVQRYSINYLLGDRRYRLYFMLLTLTTIADSIAWISNDLRMLLVFWGMTLFGLTILIKLNQDWEITRKVAQLSGRIFALSWLCLFAAILWVTQATGTWQLSTALTESNLSQLASWEKIAINLLLIVSVIIPAAQWPFQRWLLNSVVTPTPISAVMHAGIVNAGGILLTLFAPLFNGNVAQMILLIISSISVLIGTGIMLVQVDYKRQLVGSTIAQMGFMLIQCALGAYSAAITHAILHGFFKSTLFLKAGSAIAYHEPAFQKTKLNVSGLFIGVVLGILTGIGYWLTSPGEGYYLISAVILGWSLTLAWNQLVSNSNGHVGRIVGITVFIVTAFLFIIIHKAIGGLLGGVVLPTTQPITPWSILLLLVLLASSAIGMWFAHHRTSKGYAIMYLWLVRFGEPNDKMVESHPNYLRRFLSKGGPLS